jgi:hypothetical protein
MQDNAIDHCKVQDGVDFILNHFQEPLFPRKSMTNKLEILKIAQWCSKDSALYMEQLRR